MKRSWREPLADGEENPLTAWILRSFWRGATIIATIYFGAYFAHLLFRLAIAGWNS